MAAVAGHQHPAGLAVARAVHRRPEREPIVRRDVDLAGPQRHAARARPAGARRGAADLVQPVPPARRAAAARPAAAARGRRAGQARRSSILSHGFWTARVRRRSGRRRQEHHAERPRRRAPATTKNQFDGRRRARPGLPAERRDHADGREHPADGRVPAAAVRRRRRQRAAATRTTTSWRA